MVLFNVVSDFIVSTSSLFINSPYGNNTDPDLPVLQTF